MIKKAVYTLLLGMCLLKPATAKAECINAYMMGFDAYERGQKETKSSFRVNELLVICFKANRSGFVSIFDAPIEGDYEQLFPNKLTHPDGQTSTRVEAGKLYCLGGRDTFPLYHPKVEGFGIGKISIALTQSKDLQLDETDYEIPGQKVSKSRMNSHLNLHRNGGQCSQRDVKYLRYKIVK